MIAYRVSGDITSQKVANQLLKVLKGAQKQVDRGRPASAARALQRKFRRQVSRLRGRSITPGAADELMSLTDQVVSALQAGP